MRQAPYGYASLSGHGYASLSTPQPEPASRGEAPRSSGGTRHGSNLGPQAAAWWPWQLAGRHQRRTFVWKARSLASDFCLNRG